MIMTEDEKLRVKSIRKRNKRLQAILGQIIDIIPGDDLLLSSTVDVEWLLTKIEVVDDG